MIKTFKNIIIFFFFFFFILGFSFCISCFIVVINTINTDEEIINAIFPSKVSRNSVVAFISNKIFKNRNIEFIDDYELVFVTPLEVNIVLKEKDNYFYYSYLRINYYVNNDYMVNEIRDEVYTYVPEVVNAYENKRIKGDKVNEIGGVDVKNLLLISKAIKELKVEYPSIDINNKDDIVLKLGSVNVKIGDLNYLELKMKRLKETYKHVKDMKGVLDLSTVRDKMKNERYIFKKA